MLNQNEIQRLEKFTKGILQENYDCFDFQHEVDREISVEENKTLLLEKINSRFPRTLTLDVTTLKQDMDCLEEKEEFENGSLKDYLEVKDIIQELFNTPKIISVIGDSNSGKSNLIYNIIKELKSNYNVKICSYGLRFNLGEKKIYSIEELETIKNSVVILDEMNSLFDFEDRRKRKLIEKSLRLIFHNNNTLILVGNCENYKKFISSKSDIVIFFKSNISDFINGGKIKNICLSYRGYELGSSVLNLEKNECIIYNGNYRKIKVPYLERFDSKKDNCSILCSKKCANNVQK